VPFKKSSFAAGPGLKQFGIRSHFTMAMRTLFGVETNGFTALRANSRGDLIFIIVFGYPAPRAAIEIPGLFPV